MFLIRQYSDKYMHKCQRVKTEERVFMQPFHIACMLALLNKIV